MISIIIPTLNEQKNISQVIYQFKDIRNLEVIVGDGTSDDNTVKIAKKLKAKVFQNPRNKQSIAKNRNLGAKHAKGDILIFCDADTMFQNPSQALKIIKKTFKNKQIVAGMCKIKIFPKQEKFVDKFYLMFYNRILKNSIKTNKPVSSGQCQIVRRTAFNKIKGYPNMKYQEDTGLFRKLQKIGKLHYFSNIIIYESPRRYRKKGYLYLGIKSLYSFFIRRVFKKEIIKKWDRIN